MGYGGTRSFPQSIGHQVFSLRKRLRNDQYSVSTFGMQIRMRRDMSRATGDDSTTPRGNKRPASSALYLREARDCNSSSLQLFFFSDFFSLSCFIQPLVLRCQGIRGKRLTKLGTGLGKRTVWEFGYIIDLVFCFLFLLLSWLLLFWLLHFSFSLYFGWTSLAGACTGRALCG